MKIYFLTGAFGIFISGLIIGAIVVALNLSIDPISALPVAKRIDFNAFSGLLLASISIIFTFFGVFVAVLAFFGFNSIRERVEETAKKEIEHSVKEGKLNALMKEISLAEMKMSLAPGGELRQQALKLFQDTQFRGIGLAESSGADDPVEDK